MVLWRSGDDERDSCAGTVLNWNSLKCPSLCQSQNIEMSAGNLQGTWVRSYWEKKIRDNYNLNRWLGAPAGLSIGTPRRSVRGNDIDVSATSLPGLIACSTVQNFDQHINTDSITETISIWNVHRGVHREDGNKSGWTDVRQDTELESAILMEIRERGIIIWDTVKTEGPPGCMVPFKRNKRTDIFRNFDSGQVVNPEGFYHHQKVESQSKARESSK